MKAVRIHEIGGPDVMRLEDVPTPVPGADQALIKVEACGVNFIDVYYRPRGPGLRGRGVRGSYSEQHVVPAAQLVPLPDALSASDGAAAMLQGMTAHYLVTSAWTLSAGQTCLVHATAGGLACCSARWRSCAERPSLERVHHAWPLADAPDAHRALEGRATTGKLLLLS